MRSIFIEGAPVAGAHKKARFLKPANGTPKMRAIDRENLERFRIDAAHPAWNFGGVSVPGLTDRVPINGKSSLAFRKVVQGTQRNPTRLRLSGEARQGISQKRHADERARDGVQSGADLEKEVATGNRLCGRTARWHGFLASAIRIGCVHGSLVPLWLRFMGTTRCEESQATTSEISCGVIGWPDAVFL